MSKLLGTNTKPPHQNYAAYKSRKNRWVEHEIGLAKASNARRVWWGKLKEGWEVMYCITMAQNGGR